MKKFLLLLSLAIFLTGCGQIAPDSNLQSENKPSPELPWLNFVNTKYYYTFDYPPDDHVLKNDTTDEVILSSDISVPSQKKIQIFNIKTPSKKATTPTDLQAYAKRVWELNKNDQNPNTANRTVSELKQTTLSNLPAYHISLTGSYKSEFGGRLLEEETTYIFAKHQDNFYEISFPSKNTDSEKILTTFKFLSSDEDVNKYQQKNIENCKQLGKSKDQCLLNYVKKQIYYENNLETTASCNEFGSQAFEKTECYWLFAMKNKDTALCELINNEKDYFTKDNCKKEIAYSYQDAEWKLVKGYPGYIEKQPPVYGGKAKLTGWPVAKVAKDSPYFYLTPDSLKKLPPFMQKHSEYLIKYFDQNPDNVKLYSPGTLPDEILSELQKYNEKNPAKISVTKIEFDIEKKMPILTITEIKN